MLVAFNSDGPLLDSDVYVLLAEEAGVAADVAAIAEQARDGDITVAERLRQQVARLDGLPELEVDAAFDRISLRPTAADIVADLQAKDHHVAVITTTPQRAVELAFDDADAGADTIVAPQLGIENNALTGTISGRALEETSGEILSQIAVETQIGIAETVAVGSDYEDRSMLEAATDSICYDPIIDLKQHCESTVTTLDRLRTEFEERTLL